MSLPSPQLALRNAQVRIWLVSLQGEICSVAAIDGLDWDQMNFAIVRRHTSPNNTPRLVVRIPTF